MSKPERTYANENQQNLMRVVEYMSEDCLTPKTAQEIADALGLSRDQAFRICWNLVDRGWADEVAGGYRIGPRTTRISEDVRRNMVAALQYYLGPKE